jgi:hypothetical protein
VFFVWARLARAKGDPPPSPAPPPPTPTPRTPDSKRGGGLFHGRLFGFGCAATVEYATTVTPTPTRTHIVIAPHRPLRDVRRAGMCYVWLFYGPQCRCCCLLRLYVVCWVWVLVLEFGCWFMVRVRVAGVRGVALVWWRVFVLRICLSVI